MDDQSPDVTATDAGPIRTAFLDGADRSIEIRPYDDDLEAMLGLYDAIEAGDRAQGLPPVGEDETRDWLADITTVGLHLVAWHDYRAVGHACLLPAGDTGYELAIFVRSDYQHARIGTNLLQALLRAGPRAGADRVWLTVRRNNIVARRLYDSAGFEQVTTNGDGTASDMKMIQSLS